MHSAMMSQNICLLMPISQLIAYKTGPPKNARGLACIFVTVGESNRKLEPKTPRPVGDKLKYDFSTEGADHQLSLKKEDPRI